MQTKLLLHNTITLLWHGSPSYNRSRKLSPTIIHIWHDWIRISGLLTRSCLALISSDCLICLPNSQTATQGGSHPVKKQKLSMSNTEIHCTVLYSIAKANPTYSRFKAITDQVHPTLWPKRRTIVSLQGHMEGPQH